jgi:hypothetical protein
MNSSPPRQAPTSAPSGNFNMPNTTNVGGGVEKKENAVASSVVRSKGIKVATTHIISSRSELVAYLQQSGLDLLTSAVEFQQTGDFLASSYVIYRNHNNQKESLTKFLSRYPQLQDTISMITEQLRGEQSNLHIISK